MKLHLLKMKIDCLTKMRLQMIPPEFLLILCICTGRPSPLCNMMRLPQTWHRVQKLIARQTQPPKFILYYINNPHYGTINALK